MSLHFKYTPLTFLKDLNQIKVQVKNTIILGYFYNRNQKVVKLKNLIEGTQYGYNASAMPSGRNKFLRISDITDGEVNWDTVPFCDCSDEKTYLLQKNDLLIARTGGTTGKSFLIDTPPSNAIYAGYLIRIRANELSEPRFLNLFLNSYAYWSQVLSLNKGDFRPSVNATKLKNLVLPNCTLQEQNDAIKIANGETVDGYEELIQQIKQTLLEFDNCQEVINEYKSQKQLITQLKQSILQEAIQGKLTAEWRTARQAQEPPLEDASELLKRIKAEKAQLVKEKKIKKEKPLPPITEEEIPFELPEGWVWCRLGDITTYGSSEKLDSSDIQSDTWVLDLEDIEKESSKIIQTKCFKERPSLSTKSVFKKGWVLYSKLRPYLDKVVVAPNDGVCTTEILPLPIYSDLNPKFLMFTMKSKHFLQYVNSKVGGMKMPRLGTNDGKLALLQIASVSEQQEIVKKVETLMQHCEALEKEIENSEANAQMLMQSVLKEAFEGEVKKEMV